MRKKKNKALAPVAVGIEALQLAQIWTRHAVLGLPLSVAKGVTQSNILESDLLMNNLYKEVGRRLLNMFSDLGPVYGKALQIAISRQDLKDDELFNALQLDNVFGNWPALPFSEIEDILDREIPDWRGKLVVEKVPLGCASIAQVHAAKDQEGRAWVLKIVRPESEKRLHQTVDAILTLLDFYKPLALNQTSKRAIKELKALCSGLRAELDLSKERETILRMQDMMSERKKSVIRVPDVHPQLASAKVMVVERFEGTKLSDIASGKVELNAAMRQKLARKMLKELLVQVFELGLFHGDPHAGNLMLLPDGAIGLFDWGLYGELLETDRAHIAAMLRAVMAFDLERLAEVLQEMADSEGKKVTKKKIQSELKKVAELVKSQKESGKKVSLQQMISSCLEAAQKLDLHVPDGLLMMAKSLITIEGLAKGIDPDVKLGVVASPFLFKAAKPGLNDILIMSRKAPKALFKMALNR